MPEDMKLPDESLTLQMQKVGASVKGAVVFNHREMSPEEIVFLLAAFQVEVEFMATSILESVSEQTATDLTEMQGRFALNIKSIKEGKINAKRARFTIDRAKQNDRQGEGEAGE